jgi:cytochrome c551/c552
MRAVLILALLCVSAPASAQVVHREGGYWQFVKSNCGYVWKWYPVAKAPAYNQAYDNHSQTINLTIQNNHIPQKQGNTEYFYNDYAEKYEQVDLDERLAALTDLANTGVKGGYAIASELTGTLGVVGGNQARLAEQAGNIRAVQALTGYLQSVKPGTEAATVIKQYSSAKVTTSRTESGSRPAADLTATEKACAGCHSADNAPTLGGENVLPRFSDMTADQARIAKEYITRLDVENNCAMKAKLSHSAQQELLDLLCKKSQ